MLNIVMMVRGRYIHPNVARELEVIEDPILKEINTMIACIHEANYPTAENSAAEAGYTKERSKNNRNAIAIHVVEHFMVEEPVFLGLLRKETQKTNIICIIRYEGSGWKIYDTEVFNTEKLAYLFRHLKYYQLNVLLDGISEEYLKELYIEARKARPGAIDVPPAGQPEEHPGLV